MIETIGLTPGGLRIYRGYKSRVEKELRSLMGGREPAILYEPIRYILSSGGKRLRAVLVLLSCGAVGGETSRAIHAATAIEILHNFTLVHDDVMDHADVRRGRPTVHKRWDENVAILSGDEMIAQAYAELLKTRSPRLRDILNVYTDALVQVCEGQGLDKEFETRRRVNLDEYFRMISKKTGRVIAASTEIGALIGGGNRRQVATMRKFGEHLGRAFQVMDDLLDIIGGAAEFGKNIGGDVKEGKKSYLLLRSLEGARGAEKKFLKSIVPGNRLGKPEIIKVRNIYYNTGAIEEARMEIGRSTKRAQAALSDVKSGVHRDILMWLSQQLLERNS